MYYGTVAEVIDAQYGSIKRTNCCTQNTADEKVKPLRGESVKGRCPSGAKG
jgi:hypothetical protein